MDQRSMLRIVFWLVFASVVILSISPNPVIDTVRSGYFITHQDDWVMLLAGVAVVAVFAWIGLKI